ncbi:MULTISPECIES: prolyl oligopeptidase family protein [unclassified Aureispira]|uniref:prolyl oligopeptidase family serine peptidase n=1 Tax=unclassified Aureispira TaxID=2649989 RepID=UPI0009DCEF2C|nr:MULTISPECIES: prolyl oligopeptidase family serine peptidase [unclassified Aureispira]WMX13647.1 prolyl oligopeptidase family serine peptidase [Aureispira sp. CCB-E]
MKYKVLIFSLALSVVACNQKNKNNSETVDSHSKVPNTVPAQHSTAYLEDPDNIKMKYPLTRKDAIEDDFFGVKVKDPYRWLEDAVTEEEDKEVNKWVAAQSKLAEVYLSGISYRDDIKKRLTKLYDYERESAPFKEGGKLYFYKNDGKQDQSVVYRKDTWDGEAKVFIDPNTFSDDGTISLSGLNFSKDGKFAAYRTSESGSDWGTVYIKDATTGKQLTDKVEWLRYSGLAWYKDGFFYSRYGDNSGTDKFTQKNQFHQVYYHKVGTNQADDELIFADRTQPNRNYGVSVTEDESIWILTVTESTSGNALYYKKASEESSSFIKLVDDFKHDFYVIDNIGNKLLVYTNYQAPKYQVIEIDLEKPAAKNWRPLIPQKKGATLNGVQVRGGRLVARYTKEITNVLSVYEMNGTYVGDVEIPEIISKTAPVTLSGVSGKKADAEGYFTMSSFTLPSTICKVNVKTLKSEVWKRPQVDFNPADYEIEYTHYTSKDGTSIPISIVYKKGLKKDGNNPTLLYGYGGFNISILPSFALKRLPFLEKGGIYAVANIRGGGEMGQEWHEAGTKLKKQNVFDDFIAAGEFLIAQKYTSSQKLAIEGRSNGGLLVGACMTQRPDLYRVALPIVGVLDMMRYHQFTIGHFWASDYGRSDDSTQYKNLLSYSPVHNVKPAEYPATMVMTADHDDRVVPAHSFKFGAALQDQNIGKLPIIIRIDRKAGHGSGKPITKVIEEEADKIAFLMFNLKMKW